MSLQPPDYTDGNDDDREDLPGWLSNRLDEVSFRNAWTTADSNTVPDGYFSRFSERITKEIRRRKAEEVKSELPSPVADKLAYPMPATIPDGAMGYFGKFASRLKTKVKGREPVEKNAPPPGWLLDALAEAANEPAADQRLSFFDNLANRAGEHILEDDRNFPGWLNVVLTSDKVVLNNSLADYFEKFESRLKNTLTARHLQISESLATSLQFDKATTLVPEDYFEGFLDRVNARRPADQEEMPSWLQHSLQTGSTGPNETYFDNFEQAVRHQVMPSVAKKEDARIAPLQLVHPTFQLALVATFACVIALFAFFGTSNYTDTPNSFDEAQNVQHQITGMDEYSLMVQASMEAQVTLVDSTQSDTLQIDAKKQDETSIKLPVNKIVPSVSDSQTE